MEDVTLQIDGGYLTEVPVYEPDDCGHNWLAIIPARAPERPGGLERIFCPRGNPPFHYQVSGIVNVGSVIEFGADRVGKHGRKLPKRCYGIVRSIDEHALTYCPQPSPLAALALVATPLWGSRADRPKRKMVFGKEKST